MLQFSDKNANDIMTAMGDIGDQNTRLTIARELSRKGFGNVGSAVAEVLQIWYDEYASTPEEESEIQRIATKFGTVIRTSPTVKLSFGTLTKVTEWQDIKVKVTGNQVSVGNEGYPTEGYRIQTTDHTYWLLIDNQQDCCEQWGYFSTNDDPSDFLGKELIEIRLTDTALNTKKVTDELPYGLDAGGIQFVDFVFSDGSVLQFAVYNAHNGYYGHAIYFVRDSEMLHTAIL